MIKIEQLVKRYASRVVLDDISLSIDSGSIVAVLGKSGAGKSTLLHILGTLDKADQGEIFFDGKNMAASSLKVLADFRNTHIGFIFQFHYLLPEFSALENVCIPAWIKRPRPVNIERQAKQLLASLHLSHRMDAKPNQLSGGEQQRVAIARALINKPHYILADEPTGNLDSESSEHFMKFLLQTKQETNFTLVMVTHNEHLVEGFDRKIWMHDGKIIRDVF